MAYVDFKRGYVRFKIVYYGPKESGKTTNLEYLSNLSSDGGEIMSLSNAADNTGHFEHLPLHLGRIRGIDTMLKMYTVPGQEQYNKTRQMVLKDVDGIVFVIDSQATQLDAGIAGLQNLEENLSRRNISLFDLPVVIQYNKRDLQGALPIEKLEGSLNPYGWPLIESSASEGNNVKKTLALITQLIYKQTASQYSLVPSLAPATIVKRESLEEMPVPEVIQEAKAELEEDSEADAEQSALPKPFDEAPTFSKLPGAVAMPGPVPGPPPPPKPAPKTSSPPQAETEDDLYRESDLEMCELEEDNLEDYVVDAKRAPPPPNKLSRGLAAHLIKSIPPPPVLRGSAELVSEDQPVSGSTAGVDLEPLLVGLENRLLARMGLLIDCLQDLAGKHGEHEANHRQDNAVPDQESWEELVQTTADLRGNLNDLTAEFQLFQSSIDLLPAKLEQTAGSHSEIEAVKISIDELGEKIGKLAESQVELEAIKGSFNVLEDKLERVIENQIELQTMESAIDLMSNKLERIAKVQAEKESIQNSRPA
ncbi:MAG: hypothetical protein GY854_17865 [Deltaproteobacteria bacterium]|nr:hypothetical protein [Deltaproteobacteria bacterium]